MIDKSNFFKANFADQMTDNGPYTRETYSLEPMMASMKAIGFNTAHNIADTSKDDYMREMESKDAPPEEMEGGHWE